MTDKQPITLTPEQMEMANGLTNLNRMTVIHVVGGMSHRNAYKAAGGRASTDKAADSSVSKMMGRDKVKAFYDSLIESTAVSAIMSREEMMERLTKISRGNLSDVANFSKIELVGKEGEVVKQTVWDLKDSDSITEEQAMLLTEVSTGKDGFKFKIHSQTAAMKQLATLQGYEAPQKLEHTGKDGEPIKTEDVGNNAIARRIAFLLEKGLKEAAK
jgi:phage terminase small subunit